MVIHLLALAASLIVLGPGALAPADPGVLEAVEARRVKYGYGLSEVAGPDVVRVAVEDCEYLGLEGWLIVGNVGYKTRVVDCQQMKHTPLSELGIVADVDRAELGHKEAVIVLWK